jgi:hypothetical protein
VYSSPSPGTRLCERVVDASHDVASLHGNDDSPVTVSHGGVELLGGEEVAVPRWSGSPATCRSCPNRTIPTGGTAAGP